MNTEIQSESAPGYVIITPARNEEAHIEKTIRSILQQTIRPVEWIIVNDGSDDQTGAIIDRYAAEHDWIKAFHREDRGFRKSGGGVMDTFYDGYDRMETKDWDFIVKLDGDLSFDPDYFERVFEHFQKNPTLGIAGGVVYNLINGEPVLEVTPRFHVRGATKVYKRACWDAIGGLIRYPGWDTLDEVKANMLNWETESLPDIKIIHHRFTGSADGTWANRVKNGRGSYIIGYHPLFMLFKCLRATFYKPWLLGSMGLMYGFFSGYWKRIPQIEDKELIRYLRKQQIKRLLGQKTIWM